MSTFFSLNYLCLVDMEITGIEPVFHACKAHTLPIELYSLFFIVLYLIR